MSESAQRIPPKVNRRLLVGGGLAASAAAAVWWRLERGAGPSEAEPLLAYVCDQTVPATGTPGAVAVGVPAFVMLGLGSGLAKAAGDELERLRKELDKAAGGSFMNLQEAARLAVLTRHDAATFTPGSPRTSPWRTIKSLILMGYYTSEVGASRELQYVLDPGKFEPDLPFKKGDRGYSTSFWFF